MSEQNAESVALDLEDLRSVAQEAHDTEWLQGWWADNAAAWLARSVAVPVLSDHIVAFQPSTALALLDLLAQARTWIANCVDPAAVGSEVKQQMLDALSERRTPPGTAGVSA